MSTPYTYQPVDLRAPEGTNPSTVHIWIMVVLSFVICIPSFIYLATFDMAQFMQPQLMAGDPFALYGLMFSPAYIASLLAAIIGYGLTAVLAYLDARALADRGVQRPFHWAFSLIPSYGTYVYVIGRSVVVRRRTGTGLAPLWLFVGLNVLTFVITLAVTFAMMASMFASIEPLLTR